MKVNECMCHDVLWVNPTTTICECANLMAEHKIGCVPVCDEKKQVVGLITDRDILLRSVCCDKNIPPTVMRLENMGPSLLHKSGMSTRKRGRTTGAAVPV